MDGLHTYFRRLPVEVQKVGATERKQHNGGGGSYFPDRYAWDNLGASLLGRRLALSIYFLPHQDSMQLVICRQLGLVLLVRFYPVQKPGLFRRGESLSCYVFFYEKFVYHSVVFILLLLKTTGKKVSLRGGLEKHKNFALQAGARISQKLKK
jgi:hypothetical protein